MNNATDYSGEPKKSYKSYCIQFLDHKCSVTTPFDLKKEWTPLVTPFFQIAENEAEAPIHFLVKEDSKIDHLFQLSKDSTPLTLHCDAAGTLVKTPHQTIVLSPELHTAYIVDRSEHTITYVCKKFSHSASLDLLQLVRGVLVGLAQNNGMKVHMSVTASKDDAIAFVGGKNAGKTSFMLAFLKQIGGSSFIANDKALLRSNNRTVTVWGLPYAVSIGFGALDCCDEIPVNSKTRIIEDKAYFWPSEIAEYLNRSIVTSQDISTIVQVHIDPADSNLRFCEVAPPERKRIVSEEVITFSDKVDPHWLLHLLDITFVQEDLTDLLVQKQWYRLQGNPWNGTLKKLLKKHSLFE
jgi:hypothetical protein